MLFGSQQSRLEGLDEGDAVLERVVQWRRSDANDIGLPLIHNHAPIRKLLHHRVERAVFQQKAQLGAALLRVGRGDDAEQLPHVVRERSETVLQEGREPHGLFPQHRDSARQGKDLQRCAQAGDVEDARVAQLEAGRPLDRMKLGVHDEPGALVVAPPSRQPLPVSTFRVRIRDLRRDQAVPGVDKHATDAARAAVEILVRAPRGRVDVPFLEVQRHVAHGMSQIPDDEDTLLVSEFSNRGNIEQLTSVVLDAGQQNDGRVLGVLCNQILDVGCAEYIIL